VTVHLYNDNEQFCWSWLRRLVAAGHLPAGEVDARAVQWFTPAEVRDYTSAHFFAGLGGWPLALRMAGWPDDQPVWTASLPCQPFSNAGKRRGVDDERHLWPAFRHLVEECRPPTIFGEQVASRDGREWLAGVRADLEALGYAVGAADLCAAGVGAPHIRQRLFWVAHTEHAERGPLSEHRENGCDRPDGGRQEAHGEFGARGKVRGLGNPDDQGLAGRAGVASRDGAQRQAVERAGDDAGWTDSRWLLCLDGKYRRIPAEPALFPLAHGVPGRVGQLRAYGNAIVPQVAATFTRAFMDSRHD